jgi:redox-sensitive bicupin YhaK (pirin superfamily)
MNTAVALPQLLETRPRDLGGFTVRRLLPSAERQSVGPFVFFDHMGPTRFASGEGIDVRPHPHIGLATITYLFEGEIMHRDSLGFVQPIRPGDVNWMTAGSGIVHSERTPPSLRETGSPLHGLQLWIALPKQSEETGPAFVHHPQAALPQVQLGLTRLRLIVGSVFGAASPVRTFSPMFYFDAQMAAGAALELPPDYPERALYVASGSVQVLGHSLQEGQMLVLPPAVHVAIKALATARLVLLGGEPVDGPRFIWWNLVSSSRERIEEAKRDWAAGRFAMVPGETEFIPLPEK